MKKRLLALMLLSILIIAATVTSTGTCSAATKEITLTEDEQAFINSHPVIRLGVDPKFVPFEFIDSDGQYKGIASDYLKLIEEKTGLTFEVEKGLTWPEAYAKAVSGELDVLPCVSRTEARAKIFLFSDPYYYFQRAVYVQKDNQTIRSIDDLRDTTVAVQINSSHHSYLTAYEDIKLSLYDDVVEALQSVSTGKELAFVGNEATSNYLMKENGITNLKYSILESDIKDGLYFAVRRDWPELVSIFNKCIESITTEERISISNKWNGMDDTLVYRRILEIFGIIGAVLLFAFILSSFWITRLKKEISLRKKAETELKRLKEEAELANAYKSSFLARMSHEIRTPLNAITGMTYLLGKSQVNSSQRLYLDKISQASRNMLGIINDILDFSKIEAGKIEIEKVPFNLDVLLEQVVNIISYRVEEQDLEFSINKSPDVPTFFIGDPLRIQQIITNITNNAIKFTKEGSVNVSIDLQHRSADNCKISFQIKDTGIGMSEGQLSQIFTPFDQGDASISRRFGGTGLGLTISKNLIELMGGEIKVESTENVGSVFTVILNLEIDSSKEHQEASIKSTIEFNRLRILVIEKSPFYTNLLKDYLTAFHITSDFASSEDQGLQMLSKSSNGNAPYDLLILDYLTPTQNGIQFYNCIKEQFPDLPKCILLIPIAMEYLLESLEANGIALGIIKPFMPSTLFNTILELTKKQVVNLEQEQTLKENRTEPLLEETYHILIVEDNKTNQMIAETILRPTGCRIVVADDGKEGYEFYAAHQDDVDLILMDLHMPVMNGLEATELIRKLNTDIPVIAMTADAITGIEAKCKAAGISFYISKPFDPEQFVHTVVNVLKTIKHKPAVDYEDGLRRIGSSVDVYNNILSYFYEETTGITEKITEVIEAEDFVSAADMVHKVKGSSGNIGAKRLYKAAIDLQTALKSGDRTAIQKSLPFFMDHVNLTLAEIRKHLDL